MTEKTLIDDAFYIEETSWKTWKTYDKDGKSLVTSLTQESCIAATRAYCKWLQDGFPESQKYNGQVDGKL
jgi:hypothetical protein